MPVDKIREKHEPFFDLVLRGSNVDRGKRLPRTVMYNFISDGFKGADERIVTEDGFCYAVHLQKMLPAPI